MSAVRWWSRDYTFEGENTESFLNFKETLVVSKLEGEVFKGISGVDEWNELADLSKRLECDVINCQAYLEQISQQRESGESERYKTYFHVAVTVASLALIFFAPSSLPLRSLFKATLIFSFLLMNGCFAYESVRGLKGCPYSGKRAFILENKPSSYKDLFFSLVCPPLAVLIEVNGRPERLTKFASDSLASLTKELPAYHLKCREFLSKSGEFQESLGVLRDAVRQNRKRLDKPLMSRHLLYRNVEVKEAEELEKERDEHKAIGRAASQALQNLSRMKKFYESHKEELAV